MSIGTILLILLVIFLVGGIGPWAPGGYGYGYGNAAVGLPGILIVILIVLLLVGRI